MGLDPARVTQACPRESRTPRIRPAEPVFASLFADWVRHGGGDVVAGKILRAAVSGGAPGTGWPLRSTT